MPIHGFRQSFECSVVSPHIATCLTSAAQDFEELRSQKLQKCLQRGVNKVVQSTVEVPIDVPGGRLKPIQIEAGDSRDSIGDGGIRQPKIPFSSIRDIPSLTQLLPQVNTEPLEPHQLVSSVAEEKFPLELLPMKHNKNSANQTV